MLTPARQTFSVVIPDVNQPGPVVGIETFGIATMDHLLLRAPGNPRRKTYAVTKLIGTAVSGAPLP
jgi:hypothetical protein